MELEKIQEAKTILENIIANSVDNAISQFAQVTGYYPESIRIELIESTTVGDSRRNYVLGGVKATIDLGI